MGLGSLDYRTGPQCGTDEHHPHRVYCPRPDECCGWEDLGLVCHLDGEEWPCQVKRQHVARRAGSGTTPNRTEDRYSVDAGTSG